MDEPAGGLSVARKRHSSARRRFPATMPAVWPWLRQRWAPVVASLGRTLAKPAPHGRDFRTPDLVIINVLERTLSHEPRRTRHALPRSTAPYALSDPGRGPAGLVLGRTRGAGLRPTGMGKTLIAEAALFEALHTGKTAYYTTPLIALTEQKFREMQSAAVALGIPSQRRRPGHRQSPRKSRRPRAGRRGRNPPESPAAHGRPSISAKSAPS